MKHNHMTRDIKPVGQCPGCDQSRRWGVLRAALEYADLELLSISVAAPAAGLYEAKEKFLNSVKALIGVDHARWNEHGHISYRMNKYKKEHL